MAALKSSTMSCLGKATFRSFPQRLSAPVKDANYSTACRTLRRTISPTRPWTISQQTQFSPISNAIHIRKASTSASTTPSTNAAATQKAQAATLTWDEFLKLRRTRRYVNLVASIFAGIGSIAIATPLIAEYEIENIGAQMTGLDPMFVIGGSLMAVGGVGWLMGPFLGTAFFKVWKSSVAPEFARKEKAFYGHIKRYRADPASSSVNNPVPDYYGEKISSVASYRSWLKDQRAFNRKKNKNMI